MLMHTGRSGLTPLRRGGYLNGTLAGALIDLPDSSDRDPRKPRRGFMA